MGESLLIVAYLVASVLFILSLRGLSSQATATRGNAYGILGMSAAVLATAWMASSAGFVVLAVVMGAGAAVGALMASRVAMTSMPELVAMLHSFVGLAAVLVGLASYVGETDHEGAARSILLVEIFIDVFIGALTFTGSLVAFGKLRGLIGGRALLLPGRHALNLVLVLVALGMLVPYLAAAGTAGLWPLLVATGIAGLLGVHLVMAIGGADMPVVVSMLNSYSGWTAAAAGFMLGNDLLIITGALVGSSGAILSIIMCRAMNRSILSVMLGGFGQTSGGGGTRAARSDAPTETREVSVQETASRLLASRRVVIVPGYGMAVARAQHAIHEITELLRQRGVEVVFAIHPVAGRLPGHMNVLLAEAAVPYDIVFEMDEVQDQFRSTDVSLVVGANDIVNPAAETDPESPIWGMPVIHVWEAKETIICKRSKASGYAGIDNPLFYHERTAMLFGDAKEVMDAVVAELRRGTG
ncbi:MAG: NAD(P)(+) transhydrogenase (Re/Si-specific) subunit beta [Deltaproteobacteria bacterium]|nr:NAD(P)(+) transhydrogenase (Re/Si-specific) subunit beta [Deltaproteobacteria bacterium]MCB9788848.1 NAD(P)(+) transhydrogenase (Re/Si-specific) subunit beta [Deltaproteobacteria bacterium]